VVGHSWLWGICVGNGWLQWAVVGFCGGIVGCSGSEQVREI